MGRQAQSGWVALSPPFPERSAAKQAFRAHAVRLSELLSEDDDGENFNEAIEESLRVHSAHEHATALRAALCVLTDLARQRWSIRVNEGSDPEVKRSEGDRLDPRRMKARIRAQELVKRDEQLREPAARRFIEGIEKKSVHNGHFVSIYSVIRDGREPRRVCRRLQLLRGWSYDEENIGKIFT